MDNKKLIYLLAFILMISFSVTIACKQVAKNTNTIKPIPSKGKAIDLEGRVIKIVSMYNEGQKSGKLEDVYSAANNNTSNQEYLKVKRIQDDYNCTLEYVSGESTDFFEKILPSIQTGEPLIDFLVLDEASKLSFKMISKDSLFENLKKYSDILEIDNSTLWDTEKIKKSYPNDIIETVCSDDLYNKFFYNDVMFFNKSMMIEAGLWEDYNLNEMQKNKTWTWDVFKELCQKVTRDTDDDGKSDQFGIFYNTTCLNDFAISNGDGKNSSLVTSDNNGNPHFAINEPAQMAAFNMLSSLNDLGCIKLADSGQNPYLQSFDSFVQGNELFLTAIGQNLYELKTKMKDEWGIVSIPMGPDNNKQYYIGNNNTPSYSIVKNAKDSEKLAYVLKEFAAPVLSTEEMISLNTEYLKDTANGFDGSILETYELLTNKECLATDISTLFSQQLYFFDINVTETFNKKITIKKLLNEITVSTQKAIDDYWLLIKPE